MSDNEMRQQKAMLMLDHQEAKQHLAALRGKSIRIGLNIQHFGRLLERDPATKIFIAGRLSYEQRIEYLDEQQYRTALSFDGALDLADEIRSAIATVKDLRERLDRFS